MNTNSVHGFALGFPRGAPPALTLLLSHYFLIQRFPNTISVYTSINFHGVIVWTLMICQIELVQETTQLNFVQLTSVSVTFRMVVWMTGIIHMRIFRGKNEFLENVTHKIDKQNHKLLFFVARKIFECNRCNGIVQGINSWEKFRRRKIILWNFALKLLRYVEWNKLDNFSIRMWKQRNRNNWHFSCERS